MFLTRSPKIIPVLVFLVLLLAGCEQNQAGNQPGGDVGNWRDSRSAESGGGTSSQAPESESGEVERSSGTRGGVRQLSGGGVEITGVPNFRQGGSDAYSPNGQSWRPFAYCGPTSLQMVMSYYGVNKSRDYWGLTVPSTGQQVRTAQSRGQVYLLNQGATYQPMVEMAKKHGLSGSRMVQPNSIEGMKRSIAQGRPQIVSIKGTINYIAPQRYSRNTAGHVIVVVGVTGDGNLIVNDPATGQKHTITGSSFRSIWRGFSVDIGR